MAGIKVCKWSATKSAYVMPVKMDSSFSSGSCKLQQNTTYAITVPSEHAADKLNSQLRAVSSTYEFDYVPVIAN